MRFAFIDVEKASYPLRVLCRVLHVSKSGFYAWLRRKPSNRELEDERLRPKIVDAFKIGRGTYGSPRVQGELVDQGIEEGLQLLANDFVEKGLLGFMAFVFDGGKESTGTDTLSATANQVPRPP
jgi:putative transposase